MFINESSTHDEIINEVFHYNKCKYIATKLTFTSSLESSTISAEEKSIKQYANEALRNPLNVSNRYKSLKNDSKTFMLIYGLLKLLE